MNPCLNPIESTWLSTLIVYLLSCHTFFPREKDVIFYLNCTLLKPEGNTRVGHLLSGHCTHQQIRSSSTLIIDILILATLLFMKMVVVWVFTADCSSVPDWLWDVGYNSMHPPKSFLLHHKTASVLSNWEKAVTASYISLTLGSVCGLPLQSLPSDPGSIWLAWILISFGSNCTHNRHKLHFLSSLQLLCLLLMQ